MKQQNCCSSSSPPLSFPSLSSLFAFLKSHIPSDSLSSWGLMSMNFPLSEKMTSGEPVEDAAAHAVREELGENVRVRVLMETYWVKVDEEESVSYPGLPVRYLQRERKRERVL
ncbi:LOW QUALITY PROTEIN: uncharacterized protein LOC109821660 [Asparagus officinalis]|uniref:LOW QUALITY PROTEIN: uncharacterized protein LOC109821660 n=1 Tax=Asparagus officinalis TaxID=4686 RepID=UPI00098E0AF2|nr:LOW QUALITY PROTEIN: uncharacterized protein LOC109821660 [Asparagus officinalis]